MSGPSQITVLHLSDLQFGKNHLFGRLKVPLLDAKHNSLAARLLDDLKQNDLHPDLLVVSGDIAECALPDEFKQAAEFLEAVSTHFGLERDRVVLVPGNHDVNRHLCHSYFSRCAGSGEEPLPPFSAKWEKYADFVCRFYGTTPDVEFPILTPWKLFKIPDLRIVVAGLNSTIAEVHDIPPDDPDYARFVQPANPGGFGEFGHFGRVTESQCQWFAEQLEQFCRDGWFRLGVLHHNVRRGATNDDEHLVDAELLFKKLGPKLNLLLHGHTHDGKQDLMPEGVLILSTGSAALDTQARPVDVPCQYQVLRIHRDCVERFTRRYDLNQSRWTGDTRCSASGNEWQIKHAVTFEQVDGAFPKPQAPVPHPKTSAADRFDICQLPTVDYEVFGRDAEIEQLNRAWYGRETRIVTIVGGPGSGKTAVVNRWLQDLTIDPAHPWGGAEAVFAWSFFGQGAAAGGDVSSDFFIDRACRHFGLNIQPVSDKENPICVQVRAKELADTIASQRAIIVLDGMEPLQTSADPKREGQLLDDGLRSLLRTLAIRGQSLCIVTSRLPVWDLRSFPPKNWQQIILEPLVESARLDMLKHRFPSPPSGMTLAQPTEEQLEAASRDFGGHPLTLQLLTPHLLTAIGGGTHPPKEIGSVRRPEGKEGVGRRILNESEEQFSDRPELQILQLLKGYEEQLSDRPELQVLHLLGLFDRPATNDALLTVRRAPAIAGVTDGIEDMIGLEWNDLLTGLQDQNLIKFDAATGDVDCHPFVREFFGERLRTGNPGGWKAAHERLYEYFRESATSEQPNIEELEPLYQAVIHGCKAHRFRDAWQVFWKQIQREKMAYPLQRLGVVHRDLTALVCFFQEPWSSPIPDLSSQEQASALTLAGQRLRAVGRCLEGQAAFRAALARDCEGQRWDAAGGTAAHLCAVSLILGKILDAKQFAELAVGYAERAGDLAKLSQRKATLAYALHQLGAREQARALFEEAVTSQPNAGIGNPSLGFAYSYRFCDLLLDLGDIDQAKAQARSSLSLKQEPPRLLDLALDTLALGRAELWPARSGGSPDLKEAEGLLELACQLLYQAGMVEHLPPGLFARAELRCLQGRFSNAWDDLTEACEIAERGGMQIHIADHRLKCVRFLFRLVEALQNPSDDVESLCASASFLKWLGTSSLSDTRSRSQTLLAKGDLLLETTRRMVDQLHYLRRHRDIEALVRARDEAKGVGFPLAT